MKKLFIAVLAIAGLASCTNSDVEFETAQKQIGLSPITENRTRAMVSGTAFPAENFMVWAWYNQVAPGTQNTAWDTETDQLYINQKTFAPKSNNQWAGGDGTTPNPYYWPKLGSLLFAGYYPTSVANVSYTFDEDENVMTIAGYTPGDYENTGFVTAKTTHEEDLMYFKMTESSYNCATTSADAVDVVFQHALAWIKVTLAKAEDTPADATITVSSVKFTDVYTTGTGTVEGGADTDTDIVWDVTGSATADIVVWNDAATALTTTPNDNAKEPVVIPQAMVGNIVITYTIASKDDSKFTEVKTIALKTLKDDATTPNTIDEWEAGKCYTYTITIGTSEILIEPTVDPWDNVTVPVEVK